MELAGYTHTPPRKTPPHRLRNYSIHIPFSQAQSTRPLLALAARIQQLLLERTLTLCEALRAAPREGLVRERRLRYTLLVEAVEAEALGLDVIDAALAERASPQRTL